jgi:DNA-binding transcriptional LysR family regulator
MALDPHRLLLLPAIRDEGTITLAAARTGRTPPAISQQLARLEQEAGAPLVERHPRGARLTSLGARLAEHADRVAAELDEALDDAAHYLREHRDRLRLGAFPTAGLALLPDALAALRHQHPDAELSVVDLGPTEGMDLVAEHQLDLALVGEYAEELDVPAGVELVPLLQDPLHVVLPANHHLAESPAQPRLADFASDAWACAPRTLPNRRQLEQAARARDFTPRVPFEPESYAVAEALVSAGVAIAFLPRIALTDRAGTAPRPLADAELFRRVHAAVPTSTRHVPLTAVFVRLLEDVCDDFADE